MTSIFAPGARERTSGTVQPLAFGSDRDDRAPGSISDEELMSRLAAGRIDGLEELMRRYRGRLTEFVFRIVGDFQRSEEIVEDVFFRVYRAAGTFDASKRFSTWLYTIAERLAWNGARDARRRARPMGRGNWKKGLRVPRLIPLTDLIALRLAAGENRRMP